jgi:branched-chain amino acid transport system permease protein
MNQFLTFTIIGIVTGAAYAVAASGLVVTYATSGIFNIAHGAIGMFMAFFYWQLVVPWHVPPVVALLTVVLLVAPAFGAAVELILIRRVRGNSLATTLVVTIGLMVLLIGLVSLVWKPTARIFPPFFGHAGYHLGPVFVTWHETITVFVAVGIAIGLRLLLYRTRVGIAMRAVVDNRELAALNGARPALVGTLSWALGASMASLAGILIAPTLQLSVLPLTLLVVNAYAAAMVGRLRSLPFTFLGALIIGLSTSYAVGYMPSTGFWGSTPLQGLRLSIPAVLLFIVLLWLPQSQIEGGSFTMRRQPVSIPSFSRSLGGGALLVIATIVVTNFLSPGNLVYIGIGLASGLVMLSMIPLTGWGGQVSLCQMTFAGLGAYAMHKFGAGGSVIGLFAALALAGVVGALIALPALRLRGLYLALATMAFAVAMDNMFFPSTAVFGFDGSVPIARASLLGLHVNGTRAYVIFLAVVFAVLSVLLLAMRRGPFGRVLSAMKDSEAACATLGLSLTTTKLFVFALSAGLAGMAGAMLGGMKTVAGSTDFYMLASLPVLLLVVVWGVATPSGALLGGISLGLLYIAANKYPWLSSITFLATGAAGISLGANPDGMTVGIARRLRRIFPERAASEVGAPEQVDVALRTAEAA